MSAPGGLDGLTAVLFENRLSKTLADLVRLRGGTPFSAPALKEVPLEENAEALRFGDRLAAGEVDVLILLTGVGTRALFDAIAAKRGREAVKDALARVPISGRRVAVQEYGEPLPELTAELERRGARGIEPDVEPVSTKMGPLVADTAERAKSILEKKRGRPPRRLLAVARAGA